MPLGLDGESLAAAGNRRVMPQRAGSDRWRKARIALYGSRDGLDGVLRLLDRLGSDSIWIAPDTRQPFPKSWQVDPMSIERYVRELDAPNRLVVVVAPPDEQDNFLHAAMRLRKDRNLRSRLLHPAALLHLLSFDLSRIHISGYPGSGNMVFQELIKDIAGTRHGILDEVGDVARGLGSSYFRELNSYVDARFTNIGLMETETLAVAGSYTCKYLFDVNPFHPNACERLGRFVCIYGLPSPVWSWSDVHTSHEPMDRTQAGYWTRKGFLCLAIVRHPLDVIVSNAAKYTVTYHGGRHAHDLLGNMDWVASMTESLECYLEGYLQCRDLVRIFRYEDMRMGLPFMQALEGALGGSKHARELERIYHLHYGKPFYSTHFWKPGDDKYREYFRRDQIDWFRDRPLARLAAEFGYEIEDPLGGTSRTEEDAVFGRPDPQRVALNDFRYWGITGKPIRLNREDLYPYFGRHFSGVASDPEGLEAMRSLDNDEEFEVLCESFYMSRKDHKQHYWWGDAAACLGTNAQSGIAAPVSQY